MTDTMSDSAATGTDGLSGPDLARGIPASSMADGAMLAGHAHGHAVLLARRGDEFFATGATCTHWGAPLADGLLAGDTVRCPWHHACFNLRTGEAVRAPALDPLARWRVEVRDGVVHVGARLGAAAPPSPSSPSTHPASVVIVGGGAAGNAAAEMLRRLGYAGRITMLSADASVPCDRPKLSKGFLSGAEPDERVPLRDLAFYETRGIELKLDARVAAIDAAHRHVELVDGTRHSFDALLLATGADPVHLPVPGATLPHVHYLRTRADARALVDAAPNAERAVVIGASFIGLEVAAALRARSVAVDVVAPEAVPMAKILGEDAGRFLQALHERHGVTFHLGAGATAIDDAGVTLKDGTRLPADLVLVGIGVRPATALAEQAGLAIDHGVVVNQYLETSVKGIFAAGDIARWPDARTGEHIRVEHWVVAERQGQTAARNILGAADTFDAVPFFWTDQYDFTLAYTGHAEQWDVAQLDGQLDAEAQDCTITYRRGDTTLAVATVQRDRQSLKAELAFEQAT